MRAATPALVAHLNSVRAAPSAQIFMADCYDIILLKSLPRDVFAAPDVFQLSDVFSGQVLSVTNVDIPVTIGTTLYLANFLQIDGLRYKASVGLDVDQQRITIGARGTDLINGVPFLLAARNGALDGAQIIRRRAFFTDWLAPAVGTVTLFKGCVATIEQIGRTSANVMVNSDLTLLDVQMPRNLYAPSCLHVLYDSGCGLAKNAYAADGVVGAGSTRGAIVWGGATAAYKQGRITFATGVNAGISAGVKDIGAGTLILAYPLGQAPAAGDTFTVTQGCDHTMATCKAKFNNLAHFRGFPFVPPPTSAF